MSGNNILCHNNIAAGTVSCRNIPSKKLFYYYGELEMSETKELAQAIAYELSEYFLQIAGDDYRELYVERKVHLAAISELEKQLGEANARIAELEASIDQLIKAGRAVTSVAEWRYTNLTELLAWDTLVDNIYKEREK